MERFVTREDASAIMMDMKNEADLISAVPPVELESLEVTEGWKVTSLSVCSVEVTASSSTGAVSLFLSCNC